MRISSEVLEVLAAFVMIYFNVLFAVAELHGGIRLRELIVSSLNITVAAFVLYVEIIKRRK